MAEARKDDSDDGGSSLLIVCTRHDYLKWWCAARAANKAFPDWIRETLDRAAAEVAQRYKPPNPPRPD